jgi:hypothetical protein
MHHKLSSIFFRPLNWIVLKVSLPIFCTQFLFILSCCRGKKWVELYLHHLGGGAKMTGSTLNIYISSIMNCKLQIFTPIPTLDKHIMKARRCGGTAPLILNAGTWYIWAVSFGSRPLYTDTHLAGRWTGIRDGLDALEKRKITCPRREQPVASSLYRLIHRSV